MAGAVMAGGGGFWLVRDRLIAGDSVFALVEVSPAGSTLVAVGAGSRFVSGSRFAATRYATDLDLWDRRIIPQLLSSFGLAGLCSLAGSLRSS